MDNLSLLYSLRLCLFPRMYFKIHNQIAKTNQSSLSTNTYLLKTGRWQNSALSSLGKSKWLVQPWIWFNSFMLARGLSVDNNRIFNLTFSACFVHMFKKSLIQQQQKETYFYFRINQTFIIRGLSTQSNLVQLFILNSFAETPIILQPVHWFAANEWTGFCIPGTTAMKELKRLTKESPTLCFDLLELL